MLREEIKRSVIAFQARIKKCKAFLRGKKSALTRLSTFERVALRP